MSGCGIWGLGGCRFRALVESGAHTPGVGADLMRNGEISGLHGILL